MVDGGTEVRWIGGMAEYLKTLETRARHNSSPSSQGKTKAPSRFAPVCTEEVLPINAETIPKLKYFDKLLAYMKRYHPLPAKASFRFTLGGGGVQLQVGLSKYNSLFTKTGSTIFTIRSL